MIRDRSLDEIKVTVNGVVYVAGYTVEKDTFMGNKTSSVCRCDKSLKESRSAAQARYEQMLDSSLCYNS